MRVKSIGYTWKALFTLYHPLRTIWNNTTRGWVTWNTISNNGRGEQLYAAPPGIASLWTKPHPRDYAKAIVMLLTDKNLREKLSRQAREWAQRRTWGRILPRYEKLYEKLMDS